MAKGIRKRMNLCVCRGLVLASAGLTAGISPAAPAQKVRVIEPVHSDLAEAVVRKVEHVPFSLDNTSSVLLEGDALPTLDTSVRRGLKETYQAGYSIILINPTLFHVRELHDLLGQGVNYRLANGTPMQMYAMRRVQMIPQTVLLFATPLFAGNASAAHLEKAKAGRDVTSRQNRHAIARVLSELRRLPDAEAKPPRVRDPNQPSQWQDNPVQTSTLAINDESGVYNTAVNVFALHRCLDDTDHYVITAEADWTPTEAHFESAGTEDGSMYRDSNNEYQVKWQNTGLDASVGYCGSPSNLADGQEHVCQYVNYPLNYKLTMVPPSAGTVLQIAAAPAGSQGLTSSYSSGFTFDIGGTVNVSGEGPSAGISAGASWSNSTSTTVPPLEVQAGNTGNQGAFWTFQYCTVGTESDGGSCTSHVQTNNGCRNRFGSNAGDNPQQGQTPNGKFSNAVQSVHWQAAPDTRVPGGTFDMEVNFTASMANTITNLYNYNTGVDPNPGACNFFECDCASYTSSYNKVAKVAFEVPYPSTVCTQKGRPHQGSFPGVGDR